MAFIITVSVALSLLTIVGDFMVKLGSERSSLWWVALGAFIYAFTAYGWFYVFSHKMKFSTAGALYALIVVVFHVLLGAVYFKDPIRPFEYVGFGFAVVALVLLSRYA